MSLKVTMQDGKEHFFMQEMVSCFAMSSYIWWK